MSRGNVTITWTADAWRQAATPALNAGLTQAAAVMANQSVENFGTDGGGVEGAASVIDPTTGAPVLTKTGRVKKIRGKVRGQSLGRGKRRKHTVWVPSLAGGFPGVRTSNLRNSVAFVSPEALGTPLHAAFGTAVKYGRHLEFGTHKMPARPWAMRSALMARQAASARFVRTASALLKKAGMVQ